MQIEIDDEIVDLAELLLTAAEAADKLADFFEEFDRPQENIEELETLGARLRAVARKV